MTLLLCKEAVASCTHQPVSEKVWAPRPLEPPEPVYVLAKVSTTVSADVAPKQKPSPSRSPVESGSAVPAQVPAMESWRRGVHGRPFFSSISAARHLPASDWKAVTDWAFWPGMML